MSIRAVARQLNVSPATVSLALKGDARVSTMTRQRVIEHCLKIGYTPSFSGRTLSIGRSFTLHVVYLTDDGSVGRFLSDFLMGASRAASARQYRITLSVIRGGDWEDLRTQLQDGSADGFLLLNPREGDDYAVFEQASVPLLVVGRSAVQSLHVDSDNLAVGRDIGVHLRGAGYQNPVLLGPERRTFTGDRLLGLRSVYSGLPLLHTSGLPQEVLALASAALEEGHDALIVTDDAMLTAILKALKRANRKTPEVGLIGMGNDVSAYLDPEITSINFGAVQIGEAAAGHLLDHLNTSQANAPNTQPYVLTVPHRLVTRESTNRSR